MAPIRAVQHVGCLIFIDVLRSPSPDTPTAVVTVVRVPPHPPHRSSVTLSLLSAANQPRQPATPVLPLAVCHHRVSPSYRCRQPVTTRAHAKLHWSLPNSCTKVSLYFIITHLIRPLSMHIHPTLGSSSSALDVSQKLTYLHSVCLDSQTLASLECSTGAHFKLASNLPAIHVNAFIIFAHSSAHWLRAPNSRDINIGIS
ncbi:hypothetical protein L1987_24261 [Smallanthus sonchifolius]|uniref:Uncharacterized protein n=1 Tax=Smallanthus sonchifolius TaxID=185202 RepID=A0ACB9IJQ8_9ASTR|nr:hypothetical protein L1987_24261 [Smallanthus sonchifolius]